MRNGTMKAERLFYRLTQITIIVTLFVIVLGAYTRLSHAGLGCPDWPGCYGRLVVPGDETRIAELSDLYPERPLEPDKAWKEMIHRYAAGILGILILSLFLIAWVRRDVPGQPVWLPACLLALVVFQAILGMWTVTLLLKPVVVVAHLLGGMTLLLLLVWMLMRQKYPRTGGIRFPAKLYPWAILGLVVIYVQVSLGGWTSANYAALICPDLPVCQGQWWPKMDFREGFLPWRGLGTDYEFGVLDTDARTAVHVSHRIGALVTLAVVGAIALFSIFGREGPIRYTGIVLLLLLLTQFSLGIANILLHLPISVAVAHNAVGALLLACMGVLLFYTTRYGTGGHNP